ncbi:MAG: T9SS type A sorting domain-containing protein [Ignavibacteriales bacterium]|nr:MAG: T9SS type A sorting domain-containing protein [Ignavibacteriales bacterium]
MGPAPGERRLLMGFGPITFAPGDTQEVVIAIIIARGSDNIQSVAELKKKAITVQKFFDLYQPELVNIHYEYPKPEYYYIGQNYPNPFNPSTKIKYELPVSGLVTLKVYDILGNVVETLVNQEQTAGEYEVEFKSEGLASGIYFYQISSREFTRTKKMILQR